MSRTLQKKRQSQVFFNPPMSQSPALPVLPPPSASATAWVEAQRREARAAQQTPQPPPPIYQTRDSSLGANVNGFAEEKSYDPFPDQDYLSHQQASVRPIVAPAYSPPRGTAPVLSRPVREMTHRERRQPPVLQIYPSAPAAPKAMLIEPPKSPYKAGSPDFGDTPSTPRNPHGGMIPLAENDVNWDALPASHPLSTGQRVSRSDWLTRKGQRSSKWLALGWICAVLVLCAIGGGVAWHFIQPSKKGNTEPKPLDLGDLNSGNKSPSAGVTSTAITPSETGLAKRSLHLGIADVSKYSARHRRLGYAAAAAVNRRQD